MRYKKEDYFQFKNFIFPNSLNEQKKEEKKLFYKRHNRKQCYGWLSVL